MGGLSPTPSEAPQEEGRAHAGTHRDTRFPWFTRIALKSLRALKSKMRTP